MSLMSLFDKVCRNVTTWLVDHKFREEVWSPLENSVRSRSTTLYHKLHEALYKTDFTGLPLQHAVMSNLDRSYTAYGAHLTSCHVNLAEFNINVYEGKSLVLKTQNYFARSRERLVSIDLSDAFARTLIACGVDPTRGKWTRFFHTNAWLLGYLFLKHPDYRDIGEKYLRVMCYMCILEEMGKDFREPQVLRAAEDTLLNVLCSGFYAYSFNSYAKMLSFLPADFKTRMPLAKLKMKRDKDYQYAPAEVSLCENSN